MASIYKRKLKNGDISYQVLFRKKKRGFEPIVISKAFETEKEAKLFVKELKSKDVLNLLKPKTEACETTFADAVQKYVEQVIPTKKQQKQDTYKLNVVLKNAHFSNYFLSNIKGSDLAKYRDQRLKVVSLTTVSHELALISHIFSVAIKEWSMDDLINPVSNIKKPGFNKARSRRVSDSEIEYILNATTSDTLKNTVILAVETGMRQSEIAKLEFKNINFKAKTVLLTDTKNGTDRTIPLSKKALSVLQNLKNSDIKSGTIFDIFDAQVISVSFKRALLKARKQYEQDMQAKNLVPDPNFLNDLHFHDLRHEAISRFFELGLETMEVSAISGHKDLKMLKRYTHIKAEHLVAKIEKLKSQV